MKVNVIIHPVEVDKVKNISQILELTLQFSYIASITCEKVRRLWMQHN